MFALTIKAPSAFSLPWNPNLIVSVPLGLILPLLLATLAFQVLTTGSPSRELSSKSVGLFFWIWVVALIFGALNWTDNDWGHLFWSSQIPLLILFLNSGALLCRSRPGDALFLDGAQSESGEPSRINLSPRSLRDNGSLWFMVMCATLGTSPLFLETLFPYEVPARNIGEPIPRTFALAMWGFGGALPEFLTPTNEAGIARGVGFLPREVTVPMGSLLVASWVWLAHCTLLLIGALIRPQRLRITLLILAPAMVGLAVLCIRLYSPIPRLWDGLHLGYFDLMHGGSGIWDSDPAAMKALGPTVLAACCAGIAILVFTIRRRMATLLSTTG